MVRLYDFPYLEKGLVEASLKVVYQVAALVPVVLSPVEHFELDVGSLASLHCNLELILGHSFLLWHVLYCSERSHRIILFGEKGTDPRAETGLLLHFGDPHPILELHLVLLCFLLTLSLLLLCPPVFRDYAFPVFPLAPVGQILCIAFDKHCGELLIDDRLRVLIEPRRILEQRVMVRAASYTRQLATSVL